MPHYVILVKLIVAGRKAIKRSPDRTQAGKRIMEAFGGNQSRSTTRWGSTT